MTSFDDIEKQVLSHVEYGEDIRPVRDWLVLLSIAGVMLVASIGWNVWLYIRVVNGEGFGSSVTNSSGLNTAALDGAQAVFQKRATEEENYRGAYHFVDPSK